MDKKLLFVASTRAHICHFHLPYLRQFKEDGWVVHGACGGDDGEIPCCAHVLHLPLRKRMFALGNFRATHLLKKQILQEKYTSIIVHTSLAAFFTRLAILGMKHRPKVINMVHGYLFDERTPLLKRSILLAAEKLTASVTDLLITMNCCDTEIAKRYKLGTVIETVPGLGVDFSALELHRTGNPAQLRRTLDFKKDDFVLIYPAEFSSRKMQHILLRAMTVLPESTVLVLPGTGQCLAACQKLAQKLGIVHRVRFPGYVEDIAPWYEMANAAVSSSRSEGLPFSMMEAMWFGLPVVASDVKGHTDLIVDKKTGLLYPCGDWVACAEQIRRLTEDPKLVGEFSKSVVEYVRQYDLNCVQPQVMALYRTATCKKETDPYLP